MVLIITIQAGKQTKNHNTIVLRKPAAIAYSDLKFTASLYPFRVYHTNRKGNASENSFNLIFLFSISAQLSNRATDLILALTIFYISYPTLQSSKLAIGSKIRCLFKMNNISPSPYASG